MCIGNVHLLGYRCLTKNETFENDVELLSKSPNLDIDAAPCK